MAVNKTVFIIPGYRQKPTQKAYKEICALLEREGYTPVPIAISWKQRTVSQNTEYFLKEFKKVQRKNKYILGFSFGAMIAFLASTKVEVDGLILCSLSPYFQEDLRKVKKNMRYNDFSSLHFASLVKQIKSERILMLYGSKESRSLIKRVKETYRQISSTQKILFPIEKTDHDIGSKRYLQTIHQAMKGLR